MIIVTAWLAYFQFYMVKGCFVIYKVPFLNLQNVYETERSFSGKV